MLNLSRLQALSTLRAANLDVAFATAFVTLTTGTFMVGFVRFLGGSDRWINFLAAVPSLLGILQIPGAIWGRGVPSYKRFVLPGGLVWRLLYLPLIALPFVAIAAEAKLILLATCVALASAASLLVNPIYNDWLAELVPATHRGWYFGRRQVIAVTVGAIGGTLGGVLLDGFRRTGQEAAGFGAIFALGCACAALSFALFMRMRDIPRAEPVRQPLRQALTAFWIPIRDRSFRVVLLFFVAFMAGQTLSGNLFSAFLLESLKMPFTVIQVAMAAHALGMVLLTPFWAFLSDKYGNRPLLFVQVFGLTLTPVMYLLCHPGMDVQNAAILIAGHLFSGIVWGGVALCQLNLLFATAKPEDRANYLGVGMAVQAIVGGLAPLAGAEIMESLRGQMAAAEAYKWLFVATMAARFASLFFLLPVSESGSVRIREALKHIRRITPRGYAAMRSMARSESAAGREQAIRRAATEQMSLANEEIVDALHDPSPRVRREAASALAKIGDESAVEGLIHQLVEHPDLVEEEAVAALGELGSARAVEPLIRLLQSPRAVLRRAAARSLGRIGHPEAVTHLLAAAEQAGDPDLRRASLQALRMLGAGEGGRIVGDALFDPDPSVRIAAAELVAELRIVKALPYVRQSLSYFDDEAESEVAYALGAVGSKSDMPLILEHARHCASITTRRRCLLGVARLLGVEAETYRMFLKDGIARDAALLEALGALAKRNKKVREAQNAFAGGAEEEAIRCLAALRGCGDLEHLAETPVPEAFVIGAVWIQARSRSQSRGARKRPEAPPA